jgi:transcriptional regulator with XRE-family HTH domain
MVEGQHTPGPAEGKIGLVLERARKDRGLSLEEAERATKIRKRYLIGLEQDDHTVLPDAVYARGFLKTYANFLGLDGDGLSQDLRTRKKPRRERRLSYAAPSSDFDRPIISPGGVPGAEKRQVSKSTLVTFVIAALVIAALVGALYFVGLNVRPSAAEDAPQAERLAAPMEPAAGDGEAGEEPGGSNTGDDPGDAPSGALTVGVEVEGGPAWIRVRSDSETVFEQVAPPGFSRTFEASRVVGIRAGDAGAVRVEVNGQDVGPLGDPGQVLERDYMLKSAS